MVAKMITVGSKAVPYPHPSAKHVSAVMRGNRSANTRPEVRLRASLHRMGMRFRKDFRVELSTRRVRIDIAFPKARLAVFVDGCFWHCCPQHSRSPNANSQYWSLKLKRNVDRDAEVNGALVDAGWAVIRVWEHESPELSAQLVAARLSELTK